MIESASVLTLVYIYLCVCIYTHVRTYICICVYIYTYICTYTGTYVYFLDIIRLFFGNIRGVGGCVGLLRRYLTCGAAVCSLERLTTRTAGKGLFLTFAVL